MNREKILITGSSGYIGSCLKNFPGFVENRHDQSVFSLLCKKKSIDSISAYECDRAEKENKRTWEHNFDNPILAKRDLEYNLFKRFINRQIKNFKRLKKPRQLKKSGLSMDSPKNNF